MSANNKELLRQICLAEVIAMDFMRAPEHFSWVGLVTVHALLNGVIDSANENHSVSVAKADQIAFLKRARCTASTMLMPSDSI